MKTDLLSLSHPLRHVERFLANVYKSQFTDVALKFQSFEFEPDGYGDFECYQDRDDLKVDIRNGSLAEAVPTIQAFLDEAEEKQFDVVIRSDFEAAYKPSGARVLLHMPMVDFAAPIGPMDIEAILKMDSQHSAILQALKMGQVRYEDMTYYSSGRSFHGYGSKPMTSAQWVRFMGAVLLMNLPQHERIVDDRWVGHRLVKGYSALRITANNPKYLKVPSLMECPF